MHSSIFFSSKIDPAGVLYKRKRSFSLSGEAMRCPLRAIAILLFTVCLFLPAHAESGESLRKWWTYSLKEYVRHTAYEKYYLQEIEKIDKNNRDSITPSQLAASYYPMCLMFSEKGEFLSEALFARQMLNELEKKADSDGDYLIMAKYANSAGLSYAELDFYDEAVTMFDQGTEISRRHGFDKVLAHIYANRAQLYYKSGKYEEALKMLAESKRLKGPGGDLYNNMGFIYYELKQPEKAIACFDSALSYAAENPELMMRIYTSKGGILGEIGQLDEAEKCFVSAERIQEGNQLAVQRLLLQLSFAKLLIVKGEKDKAINKLVFIEKQLMPGLSDAIKSKYLKELARMYIDVEDYRRAAECMEESAVLTDSLNYANQKRQLFQLMNWYDIARLRNDNATLKNANELANIQIRNRTIVSVATVLIALLLAVLVAISIRKRRNERRQNMVIMEQEQKLHELRQKEYEMEKKMMESEIDRKSRELTMFSIDLSSIDNLLKGIGKELSELAEDVSEDEIRKRINATSLKLRRQTASNLSDGFKKYFSEVSPDFNARLREVHPNLTQNDHRLCAYIYMGLTSKEVSQITFREVESVEKSRNRLRKKMGLENGASLREYLSSVIDGVK